MNLSLWLNQIRTGSRSGSIPLNARQSELHCMLLAICNQTVRQNGRKDDLAHFFPVPVFTTFAQLFPSFTVAVADFPGGIQSNPCLLKSSDMGIDLVAPEENTKHIGYMVHGFV